MIIKCPECKEEMFPIGEVQDLVTKVHFFTCYGCKIDLTKKVEKVDSHIH